LNIPNEYIIKQFIEKELEKYEYRKNLVSYLYLVEAIFIGIKKPDYLLNLEKKLYYEVSIKYHVKPIQVKWSIEKLISSKYNYTKDDMTSKELIHYIVDKYNKQNK